MSIPIPVLLARQQDDQPRRITTYAEIQDLLDRIEVASHSGHAGDDSAWHLLDELWEGVLRGIADGRHRGPCGIRSVGPEGSQVIRRTGDMSDIERVAPAKKMCEACGDREATCGVREHLCRLCWDDYIRRS